MEIKEILERLEEIQIEKNTVNLKLGQLGVEERELSKRWQDICQHNEVYEQKFGDPNYDDYRKCKECKLHELKLEKEGYKILVENGVRAIEYDTRYNFKGTVDIV